MQSFTGAGTNYAFNLVPSGDGVVSATVAAGAVQDAAGNTNAVASVSRTYDTTGPTVEITSTAADPTAVLPIPVTVTFDESVTGFVQADLTVTNGQISNFARLPAPCTPLT